MQIPYNQDVFVLTISLSWRPKSVLLCGGLPPHPNSIYAQSLLFSLKNINILNASTSRLNISINIALVKRKTKGGHYNISKQESLNFIITLKNIPSSYHGNACETLELLRSNLFTSRNFTMSYLSLFYFLI